MNFLLKLLRLLGFFVAYALLVALVWGVSKLLGDEGTTLLEELDGVLIVVSLALIAVSLVRPSLFRVFLGARATRARLVFCFVAAIVASTALMVNVEEKQGLLYGATFYEGPYPEPQEVVFPGDGEETAEVLAFPGQVVIVMVPDTSFYAAHRIVRAAGGEILSRVPRLGLYLVSVPVGKEAEFVAAVQEDAAVAEASPNLVLETAGEQIVDLSAKGKTPRGLIPALISGTTLDKKVILAQVDAFVGDDHGHLVRGVRETLTGVEDTLSVAAGGLPCGWMLPALCSSSAASLDALAAVMAGAEMNGQKVVINLSWGPTVPRTENRLKLVEGAAEGANAWALPAYEKYYRALAATLDASSWARAGNVLVAKSAGNGVKLVDEIKEDKKKEKVLASGGVDIAPALARLREKHPGVMGTNLVVCGALDAQGRRGSYSNFGGEMVYARVPAGLRGTSFAAPQCWGAAYNAWKEDPTRSSADVLAALTGSAKKNARGWPELDPAGALVRFRGESQSSTAQKPASDGLMCNGTSWEPCPKGEIFYCPPGGGSASCHAPDAKLCNGEWWSSCAAGQKWVCGKSGATCEPIEVKKATPAGEDPPVAPPAPVPAPQPQPEPAPAPAPPEHYACRINADCNTYGWHHCDNHGAFCSAAGTCHCPIPTEFGGWVKCPCPSGYMCIGNYCGAEVGGWPNE